MSVVVPALNLARFPSFAWNRLYRRALFSPDDPPFPNVFSLDLATTPRILAGSFDRRGR